MNEQLKRDFYAVFGREPAGAVRAPGRVNLIGEHTDYNGGFVLPIAIERETTAAYAPREDRIVRFHSAHAAATAAIDLDEQPTPTGGAWSNYPVGVAAELLAAGVELAGADVLLESTVPVGGGLSSSAALEVAAALALMAAAGMARAIDGHDLAALCQRAENEFAGAPCGIMDQSIAVMGREGMAMLMDCRSGEIRHVAFNDPTMTLLVADTQVKHDIGGKAPGGNESPPGDLDGGYPLRRKQCTEAADRLGVASLRDVTPGGLARATADGTLTGVLAGRVRHVVGEIARTLAAVEALDGGDYQRLGELMYASHASLRDDYEVSCAELDAIVASARECEGVCGARMTGGGFGGCAIVLAELEAAAGAGREIADKFEARFGRRCPIFVTGAAAGAGEA